MDANDTDLVTVHLLIYNHKPYLKDCIDSVLGQNHKPLEFLISDNNSSDGSAKFVSQNYPFLKLIKNTENLGYSRGHNQVIQRSKAAYFMPLNPDAVLTETYVQELVRAKSTVANDDAEGLKVLLARVEHEFDELERRLK